jgi:hypothetical protein
VRCAAITRGGSRCKLEATHGSYCWSHAPETTEQRRRRASRGGRAGGNGRPGTSEIAEVKAQLRGVIGEVRTGALDKGAGAVVGGLYNTLLRAMEVERRIREAEETEGRLKALEDALGAAEAARGA